MTLEDLKMAVSCQVRISLIFPLILIRLAGGLKQISRKMTENMSILASFG